MRYALQAYPARGRLPWTTPFSTELESKLAGVALSTPLHRLLKGRSAPVVRAAFSGDGKRVVTASNDRTARIWDVTWATLVRGDALRERVCAEKLIGAAQEFTDDEMEDPILRGIDKDDPIARNPCLRRGRLSLDYWARLPGGFWRSIRWLVSAN
jgi:WD40 domain-containing protein